MTDHHEMKRVLGLTTEELFRISEATTDWIAIVDSSGRLEYANTIIREQIKGAKVGCPFSDYIIESDCPLFEQAIARHSDGHMTQHELGVRCNAGNRYMSFRIIPLRTDGGQPSFFLVGFDITSERATREELRRRESLLHRAEELGGLASWSWDIKNDIGYWSDNLYRIAGHSPQSFVPKYELFMDMVHPHDRTDLIAATEAINRRDAAILEKPFEVEFRILSPDGRVVHVLGRGEAKCNEDGEPIQTFGTILDITERRKSEESLRDSERKLLEAQQLGKIGSWELNLETGVLNWSHEFYRIAGLEPNSIPASEKAFDQLFAAPEKSLLSQLLKLAQSSRAGEQAKELSREARIVRAGNDERTVFERGRVIFDSHHRALRFQGIIQDITEFKQMELALRKANDGLVAESAMLENKNIALKEVLGQIKDESDSIRQQISQNVERLVRPAIAKLRATMGEHGRLQIDALESTIMEITSPFISEIEKQFVNLTPREMEICHHIRSGLRSKEIANLLAISVQTVEKFRQKIRKKLAIEGKTVNLSSYLRSVKPK